MKSFTVAAEESVYEDEGIEFRLEDDPDTKLRAFKPTEAQMALLVQAAGRHTSIAQQIAGAIDFFDAVLDDDSSTYLRGRLLDRNDPVGIATVEDVIMWLMEEITGRPIERPSGSTRSPKRAGQNSSRRTATST